MVAIIVISFTADKNIRGINIIKKIITITNFCENFKFWNAVAEAYIILFNKRYLDNAFNGTIMGRCPKQASFPKVAPWFFLTSFLCGRIRGCLHGKTRTGASFIPGWLRDFVSRLHWWLGHFIPCLHENWIKIANMASIVIDENYACATRSSLPANRFHTETSGRFAFAWYRCEISYRSEILAPVREPGWTQAGATRAGITFCGGIM